MKKTLTIALLMSFAFSAFATCPVNQTLTNLDENWKIKLISRDDQRMIKAAYNIVGIIDVKGNRTTTVFSTSKQIMQGDEFPVVFNKFQTYVEDGKVLDRSTEGTALINGELVAVTITMNDKKDKEITLGDFINHLKGDFVVECSKKETKIEVRKKDKRSSSVKPQ